MCVLVCACTLRGKQRWKGGTGKSSSSQYAPTPIRFPYRKPPWWTTMSLLLRFRIFHSFDTIRGIFLFSFLITGGDLFFVLSWNNLLKASFTHDLYFQTKNVLRFKSMDSSQFMKSVHDLLCCFVGCDIESFYMSRTWLLHAVLFTTGNIGVMRSCFTGQPSCSI